MFNTMKAMPPFWIAVSRAIAISCKTCVKQIMKYADMLINLRFSLSGQSSQTCTKDVSKKAQTSTRDNVAPGAEVEEVKVGYDGNDGKSQQADEEEGARDLLTEFHSFLRPFVLKTY